MFSLCHFLLLLSTRISFWLPTIMYEAHFMNENHKFSSWSYLSVWQITRLVVLDPVTHILSTETYFMTYLHRICIRYHPRADCYRETHKLKTTSSSTDHSLLSPSALFLPALMLSFLQKLNSSSNNPSPPRYGKPGMSPTVHGLSFTGKLATRRRKRQSTPARHSQLAAIPARFLHI